MWNVFLPTQRYLFQRTRKTMTEALNNRLVLVLTVLQSGFVGGTTEYVHPFFSVPIFEFAQLRPRVHRRSTCTAPSDSWNLREVLADVHEFAGNIGWEV